MKDTKRAVSTGFTLVELLIVIALIAILSVAVLATINPIEQTNKARDAKFKNDAAEVISAYERYFASQNNYPWNSLSLGVDTTIASQTKIAVGGTDPLFGVLGAGGIGSTNGELIKTSELKTSFVGKEPFTDSVAEVDRLYVYHNGSDSNYVCFVPKAKANRSGSVAANLKCMNPASGAAAALFNLGGNGGLCIAMTDANWTTAADLAPDATRANLLCVPEGNI